MSALKLHSLLLAGNVAAQNFRVETLQQDPVVTVEGKVWSNGTALRYTVLNAEGAVVIKTVNDKETFDQAVALLTGQIAALSTGSTAGLAKEIADREAAVAAVTSVLNTEVADRIAADSTEVNARIAGDTAEAAARVAAIATAASNAASALATETAARIAGDSATDVKIVAVSAELDATQAGAGLGVGGEFLLPKDTAHLTGATSLANGLGKLDQAVSAEAAARTADVATLTAALTSETNARVNGDTLLQNQIKEWTQVQLDQNANADLAEQAARIAGDAHLQAELDLTQAAVGLSVDGKYVPAVGSAFIDAATSVVGAVAALDAQLHRVDVAGAAETTARVAADTAFQAALDAEKVLRAEKDTAQQLELDTIEAGAGLEATGAYVADAGTTYLVEAKSLKDADQKLDSALHAVSTRVGSIETVVVPALNASVAAEVARATKAESDEQAARIAAVSTVTSAVNAEVVRAEGVEATLAAAGSKEVTDRTAADAVLQSQIDAAVSQESMDHNMLKDAFNGARDTYRSNGPALTHSVPHNFGHDQFIAQVMVKGDDGVYRADMMVIEDDGLNAIKVYLGVPADIRVNFISTKPIALV